MNEPPNTELMESLLVAITTAHQPLAAKNFWRTVLLHLAGRVPGECVSCARMWPCDTYMIAMYRLSGGGPEQEPGRS